MLVSHIHKGHSTNSSSSHSVILAKPNLRNGEDFNYEDDFRFSWQWFKLETSEAKMKYYAAQLFCSFRSIIQQRELVLSVVQRLTHLPNSAFDDIRDSMDIYVDHESVWCLPTNFPVEFYEELREFLLRPDIVIIGGNDNESVEDLLESIEHEIATTEEKGKIESLRKRYDQINTNITSFIQHGTEIEGMFSFSAYKHNEIKKDGDYWVSFNYEDGTKQRFTFNLEAEPYAKSKVPELVDLNITDYCDSGCSWCYKNCTRKGKHAELSVVKTMVSRLKQLGVFEIALGGGETTEWPYLTDFLEYVADCDLDYYGNKCLPNINITTYSTRWLRNKELVEVVKKIVKGIGVSVHNCRDTYKLVSIIAALKPPSDIYTKDTPEIIAQHVMGTEKYEELKKLISSLEVLGIDLLLLGYKHTGRGEGTKEIEYTEEQLEEIAKELRGNWQISVSVDTLFAKKYPKFMKAIGAWVKVYSTEEGKFSCYVDAVNGKIAPSSYSEEMLDLYLPGKPVEESDGRASRYSQNINFDEQFLEKYSKF